MTTEASRQTIKAWGAWLNNGQWVHTYTPRGSQKTGPDAMLWRSNRAWIYECATMLLVVFWIAAGIIFPCFLIWMES